MTAQPSDHPDAGLRKRGSRASRRKSPGSRRLFRAFFLNRRVLMASIQVATAAVKLIEVIHSLFHAS